MLIRYAPSGPPITNVEGGMAEVGDGFLLRLSEGTTTVDAALPDLTPAVDYELKYDPATALAPFLRPRLTLPSSQRRYRVTGAVDMINNNTAITATVTAKIWVSYDEAVSWTMLGDCDLWLLGEQTLHCRIDVPMTLGSALAAPVPAGAPSMTVRMTMRTNMTNLNFMAPGGDGGTGFLQLTELL